MRRFILEGIVDPANGTEFTIIQSEIGVPFEPLEKIASRGQHLITAGIPNPLEYDFNFITASDEDRADLIQKQTEFLKRLENSLGFIEPPDDEAEDHI